MDGKTVVVGDPDNIKEIEMRFPAVKDNPRVVFTYYPHIYTRIPVTLPMDLAIHESVHLKQQKEMTPLIWWDRYLKDDDFLIEQEIEAYGTQYAFALLQTTRGNADRFKDFLASDLASDVYGNVIGYNEAESKIRRYAKTVNTDTIKALIG